MKAAPARDEAVPDAGVPENEIEITPDMIEARFSVLYEFPITEPTEAGMREAVAAVFRAMCSTRRPVRG